MGSLSRRDGNSRGKVQNVRGGSFADRQPRRGDDARCGGFTLLLSPDAFDFGKPVKVVANGHVVFDGRVAKSVETLMKWAARDHDRTMLFGAELHIKLESGSGRTSR